MPRILHSKNANSALKIEILCSNMEIRRSENANFALRNSNGALSRPPRIKWKFCTQEIEILCPENGNFFPMQWKVSLFKIFHAKLDNSMLLHLEWKFHTKDCDRGIQEGLIYIKTSYELFPILFIQSHVPISLFSSIPSSTIVETAAGYFARSVPHSLPFLPRPRSQSASAMPVILSYSADDEQIVQSVKCI